MDKKISEKETQEKKPLDARKITSVAAFAALAFVVTFVMRIQLFPVPPLTYDPKDVVIVIAGFIFGPMYCIVISIVVSLAEMPISGTGWYGLIMNVVSTCALALPATLIFRRKRNMAEVIVALAAGIVAVMAVMLPWNYIINPLYFGWPREVIVPYLLPVILPFNFFKASFNAVLIFLLYTPIKHSLIKARMIKVKNPQEEDMASKYIIELTFAALFILATLILCFFAVRGIV